MKNEVRTAQMRARLIEAARRLFARDGYAATGTEAILAEAGGVARGALYHHFADKAALFEAVCRELAAEAEGAIADAVGRADGAAAMLEAGSLAWIDFMAEPEARRILVVDAPAVLGWERWSALDRDLSYKALRAGVEAALQAGDLRFASGAEVLAVMLNGAMNQIALEAGASADAARLKAGYIELLASLRAASR